MGEALRSHAGTTDRYHHARRARPGKSLDWRRRMSNHVAWALLVYTGLQIFVTMASMKGGGGSAMPYFALVVLVAAIIPSCRAYEKRWCDLSDARAADPSLAGRFRRDAAILWAIALGLPFLLTAVFKALATLF